MERKFVGEKSFGCASLAAWRDAIEVDGLRVGGSVSEERNENEKALSSV